MATGRDEEAAEKAYKIAENRFLANDIAGALRAAREAQRLFVALPGIAKAVAAYEVHAASRANSGRWYAVLAVGDPSATTSTGAVTHESLRQQYRRLCLVLHPDKNSAAAAEGAFKLVREAWDELSLLHPPGSAAAPVSWSPPPAAADAPEWKPRQPRPRRRTMNCPHCGCSFVKVVNDDVSGVNCLDCNQWVSMSSQSGSAPTGRAPPEPPPQPPHQTETPPPPPPPPPPPRRSKSWRFPCPAHCARCGTKFTATVSVGSWHLQCDACNTLATVYVKSPYLATTGCSDRVSRQNSAS